MLEGSYAIPPREQEIPFPVRYGHRYYGTCYIRVDADWGDQPLSLLAAQRLAGLCGLILANGEHCAFLHLAQHLGRQIHASSEQVPGLTASQVNILRLLCSGSTIDEVAQQLTISKKTVERHKENIYKRLGVHNHLELLLAAYWRGYLSPLFSIEEIERRGEDIRGRTHHNGVNTPC